MQEIMERRSIRKFLNKPVEKEKIEQLLRAAMQAPSAGNQQPWEFIVVEDRQALDRLSQMSPYSKPVAGSAVTLVLLANESRLTIPTAWQQDLGAATENLLLEAVHLGLGAVWLGVSTSDASVAFIRKLYGLPDGIKPFGLVAAGYPDGQKNEFVDRYRPEKVHYEKY
jgi:nitroreductase